MSDAPTFTLALGAFKEREEPVEVMRWMDFNIRATSAEYKEKYPKTADHQAVVTYIPASWTPKDSDTADESMPYSLTDPSKLHSFLGGVKAATGVELQSPEDGKAFNGQYFFWQKRKVPSVGRRKQNDDFVTYYRHIIGFATEQDFLDAKAAREAQSASGGAAASSGSSAPAASTADVSDLLLQVIGEGGNKAQLQGRAMSNPELAQNKSLIAAIVTGKGLEALVKAGRARKDGDQYVPVREAVAV